MTIKTIYKVEGDSNEYDSEQEAKVAEALHEDDSFYIDSWTTLNVAKAITKKFLLCPILITTTIQELEEEADRKAVEEGLEAA